MQDTIFEVAERLEDKNLFVLGSRMISGESGVERMVDPETGERVWYFYAPITSCGWGFGARITEAEAMADANAQIMMTAMTLLLSLLLIFASIWFVSELIARAQERVRLQGAALESAANAIMISDAKGAISWVNPGVYRAYGLLAGGGDRCQPAVPQLREALARLLPPYVGDDSGRPYLARRTRQPT